MSRWLEEHLKKCVLTEDVQDYFMGRGGKEETLLAEGIVTWKLLSEDSPDPVFCKKYKSRGEYLQGMLICPVRSPKGVLLGFEGRSIHQKSITDFRLPEEKWNPFFLGTRTAMPKIWAGGDVWVTEGLFDKCPLEWAVPPQDAVLATVRAALSRRHIEFFRRFCTLSKNRRKGICVHMVYDQDPTGKKATRGWEDETGKWHPGALALLKKAGVSCVEVTYRGGKDPGDIWNQGGVAAIRAAFG